jgi:hypothetical protein
MVVLVGGLMDEVWDGDVPADGETVSGRFPGRCSDVNAV